VNLEGKREKRERKREREKERKREREKERKREREKERKRAYYVVLLESIEAPARSVLENIIIQGISGGDCPLAFCQESVRRIFCVG
jgi:hypothetical protein